MKADEEAIARDWQNVGDDFAGVERRAVSLCALRGWPCHCEAEYRSRLVRALDAALLREERADARRQSNERARARGELRDRRGG